MLCSANYLFLFYHQVISPGMDILLELVLLWDHCGKYCYECSHESFWVGTMVLHFLGSAARNEITSYIAFTKLLSRVAVPLVPYCVCVCFLHILTNTYFLSF